MAAIQPAGTLIHEVLPPPLLAKICVEAARCGVMGIHYASDSFDGDRGAAGAAAEEAGTAEAIKAAQDVEEALAVVDKTMTAYTEAFRANRAAQVRTIHVYGIEALPVLASVCQAWNRAIHEYPSLFFEFSDAVITRLPPGGPLAVFRRAMTIKMRTLPAQIEAGNGSSAIAFIRALAERIKNPTDLPAIDPANYRMVLDLLTYKPQQIKAMLLDCPGAFQENQCDGKQLGHLDPVISSVGGLLVQNGAYFDVTSANGRMIALGISLLYKDVPYSQCFRPAQHEEAVALRSNAQHAQPGVLFAVYLMLIQTRWLLDGNRLRVLPANIQENILGLCTSELQATYLNPASREDIFGLVEAFAVFHGSADLLDQPLNPTQDGILGQLATGIMQSLGITKPCSFREYVASLHSEENEDTDPSAAASRAE